MAEKRLKVYFLGSGEIGMPVLRKLAESPEIDLIGAGSQPDRPGKRGGKLIPTAITRTALALGINPDRPESVNDGTYLEHLRALAPDMVVVISYGQLLKEEILHLPKFGCINIHASLLPKYRGASPIQQVILHHEAETGVSFMAMAAGLDTGDVYARKILKLTGLERAGQLEMALGFLAADTCVEVLCGIASGALTREEQDHDLAIVCRKIRKEQGLMDFRRPARDLEAMIRAFDPWPGACFDLELPDREVRVTVCEAEIVQRAGEPGSILECSARRGWIIACKDKAISLKTISIPGKRVMPATGFLNGLRGAPMRIKIAKDEK